VSVSGDVVISPSEILLISRDPATGEERRRGRFLIEGGVQPTLQGLSPPVIAIGEAGRDSQAFVSSVIWSDVTAGIGVYTHRPPDVSRVWWSTNDIRRRERITLPRRKVDRLAPGAVTTQEPRAGGVFADTTWVAWDAGVYRYIEASGWSALSRTLTGSSTPQSNPVAWEGGWFWPLGTSGIDVYNGTTWWNIPKSTVGLVVYANTLWGVSANGDVWSTSITASAANTAIAAGTLAVGSLTDRVKVSDTCRGLVLFVTQNAEEDVVPYVVGLQTLYQVDPSSYVATPAGTQLPPHRFPQRAIAVAGDQALYQAQGLAVLQWDGSTTRNVGLNLDDGVPAAYAGGISHLATTNLALYAMIDSTRTNPAETIQSVDTMDPPTMVMLATTGASWLADREGLGWRVRATSDREDTAPTMLFVSTAESTYRMWFAWGGTCYSMDLEQGITNPLDDPEGEFEATGTTQYPLTTLGYYEHPKLGTVTSFRTGGCTATETVTPFVQFDEEGAWYALLQADGTHAITTNGRHEYALHASLAPTSTSPLTWTDTPAVGHEFETAQIRFDLARGSSVFATPWVAFSGLHANKRQPKLGGWSVTLNLASRYNGLTPAEQRRLLLRLIDDNSHGLLHFIFQGDGSSTGEPDTRAVDIVGFSGLSLSGLDRDYAGRAILRLSEIRSRDI
jgi:hypothetical protein